MTERIDSLRLFQGGDAEADRALEQFGAHGAVEREMVSQFAQRQPLLHPDRFPEAHRVAMRAIEVFDRNGHRRPSRLRGGPLAVVAKPPVTFLIGLIVCNHQTRVIDSMRALRSARG